MSPARSAHPLCLYLRELRMAAGLSLKDVQAKHGVSAIVLGSYERGDREPPVRKLDPLFAIYGYELSAIPVHHGAIRLPVDMATDLRIIAQQIDNAPSLMASYAAAG